MDIWSFAGDMAVFGRVVVADDEVGDVWREVVFVDAAELCDSGVDFGLVKLEGHWDIGADGGGVAYSLVRRDAGAADDDVFEGRCRVELEGLGV